ncbi:MULTISPECIES: hypothetical protein [Mycobacterium]|uniref:Uncharacterized protein n=2 Tax=Mycobacterium TaxID=1763 RepID=A0A2G5PQP2_MYCCE|nr:MULTISPECIES: hypothetical protein [Mycobacterium]EID12946.1 hypothetical protein MXEN_12086 [Mycobacterium xenopi RIVM700367]MCV7232775.1 hypothetical protein [Mycobacterium branderi]ORA40913.1 hypothetical protein BST20_01835 [Mycobacterium branderi]PIB80550.1 hypothetical protein CQY23_03145 [Mycobacterium celatum]BBZ09806.1 hypothetical protein MBRA_00010 [Mycobacterium branderi]
MTAPNPLAEQLRAFLPKDFLPTRAAASKIYTVAEGMQFAERIADALDRTERLPVSTTVTHNDDGSLTIHVTPDTAAAAPLAADA